MKQTLKISVMALVAMFAFSTAADAQFGKLKSLVGGKKKEPTFQERIDAEKKKKDDEWEALTKKMWEVSNFMIPTGKMTSTNLFPANDPQPTKEFTKEGINFADKESKKSITEQVIGYLTSDKKKSEDGPIIGSRKPVKFIFTQQDWRVEANSLGTPIRRIYQVWVISELSIGTTIAEKVTIWSAYQGGGNYSKSYEIGVERKPGSSEYWKKDIKWQYMLTDWQHDPNADPLAEFK